MLAHGTNPGLIGKSLIDLKDVDGKPFEHEVVAILLVGACHRLQEFTRSLFPRLPEVGARCARSALQCSARSYGESYSAAVKPPSTTSTCPVT
jgi:hypothetical protein